MNKRIYISSFVIIFIFFIAIWFIPMSLVSISEKERSSDDEFLSSYEQAQNRFKKYPESMQSLWKTPKLRSYPIGTEDFSIDTILADANETPENLIVITSGIHGIEGYVGSAMMDLFLHQMRTQLNPDNTGLLLVHTINPWGMKHFRRNNEHNVDLNRNFQYDWTHFDLKNNKDYEDLSQFFQIDKKIGNSTLHELGFYGRLAKEAMVSGTEKIADALLTGQYAYPKGVYYGGNADEPSTKIMKSIYEDVLKSPYQNIIHIDLHTGYGPKYQMSIFASNSETMSQSEAEAAFDYPLVFTPETEEFYVTNGDNTAYFYQLQKDKYPNKQLYSTAFEFGTLGDDTISSIHSLQNTIDENRLFWNGSSSTFSEEKIHNRYLEMFYPGEKKWREKAEQDFIQGLTGVLRKKGVMED